MGESLVTHIKTGDNLADFLTKVTSGRKHGKHVSEVIHDIYDNFLKKIRFDKARSANWPQSPNWPWGDWQNMTEQREYQSDSELLQSQFHGFSPIHWSVRKGWVLWESSVWCPRCPYVDLVLGGACLAGAWQMQQGTCTRSSVSTHSRHSPHHNSKTSRLMIVINHE